MDSDTFQTACPMCKTVAVIPCALLNKRRSCSSCFSYFIARANFVDIDSPPRETFMARLTCAWEKELCNVKRDGHQLHDKISSGSTPFSDQKEVKEVGNKVSLKAERKEALERLLAERQRIVEGERECVPLRVATKGTKIELKPAVEDYGLHKDPRVIENDGPQRDDRTMKGDRAMGKDGQHRSYRVIEDDGQQGDDKSMVVDRVTEDGGQFSVNPLQSERQRGTKLWKRKLCPNLVWGVALQKPFREKRQVRSYSPSRESARQRAGYEKGSKSIGSECIAPKQLKKRGRKPKKPAMENGQGNATVVEKGSVGNSGNAPHFKMTEPDSDGSSDEFKAFLTQEIKRQILDGLGEVGEKSIGDIQVVKVEDIHQCMAEADGVSKNAHAEEQGYVAKVKLMASLFLPLKLQLDEGLSNRPMEHPKLHMEAPLVPPQGDMENSMSTPKVPMENSMSTPKVPMEPLPVLEESSMGRSGSLPTDEFGPAEEREADVPLSELYMEAPLVPPQGDMETSVPTPKEPMEPPPVLGEGCMEPSPPMELLPVLEEESIEPSQPVRADEFGSVEEREADVPLSELYDFSCNCNEENFMAGQVWASYDCKDGMPRDYVQIRNVVSTCPFAVEIILLEPRGFPEWVKAGNALTCGEYSTHDRKVMVMKHIDVFSHQMQWERRSDGGIEIYPAERQVWALYKDFWEPDPIKRIKSGYEIVQVISVKKADRTVSVVHLIKCKGSQTLFMHQEMEPIKICRHEFVRFSHQIPIFEALDREGCMELDPAATPHHWIYQG